MTRPVQRLSLLLLIAAPIAGCGGGTQFIAGYPAYCQLSSYAANPNCAGIDPTANVFPTQNWSHSGGGGHH